MLKIGIPVIKKEEQLRMADDFRSSEYFGVLDGFSKDVELISENMLETTYNGKSMTEVLQEKGVEYVICSEMMSMTLKVFQESNIEVYKAMSESIDENLRLFKELSLPIYRYSETSQKSNCSSSCSSCETHCS